MALLLTVVLSAALNLEFVECVAKPSLPLQHAGHCCIEFALLIHAWCQPALTSAPPAFKHILTDLCLTHR